MKFKHSILLSKKDLGKGLVLPVEMSLELAEIMGIHFGDGNLNKHKTTYRIRYAFNMNETKYIDYVRNLFNTTFSVNMKEYTFPKHNSTELYVISKSLCEFFNKCLQISYGPKKRLEIPNFIICDKTYLVAFLRGLFDTDGCFTIQRDKGYEYNLLKICTSLEAFASQIKHVLSLLEIKSYICRKPTGFDVTIRRKESYDRFMSLINPKNI